MMESLLKSIGKKTLSSEKCRKDMGPARVGPEEGHKSYQRAGAPLLLRQAERLVVIQPEDENALRRPYFGFSVLKGDF